MAKERKQRLIPPLRTAEALASLCYITMAAQQRIRFTAAELDQHVMNVAEYLVTEHVLPNGEEDVIPF